MKKTLKILSFFICSVGMTAGFLSAQGSSEIYLIKMSVEGGKYVFSNPLKITQMEGYNNQPQFHPDGKSLLYSAGMADNTEIYQYVIESGKTQVLTSTPDSEYSPSVMPEGKSFSVIQLVITEGPRQGAQPLLAFPFDGKEPELLYEEGFKVGYHAWIDKDQVAMFILGSPNFLQIYDGRRNTAVKVAENIGRSLYKIPGREAISYSQSERGKLGTVMAYDLKSGKSTPIIAMKEGGDDFYAWTPSGVLMMGVGSKLFKLDPKKDSNWQEIADFNEYGVKRITRLAFGPNEQWLAVVNNY